MMGDTEDLGIVFNIVLSGFDREKLPNNEDLSNLMETESAKLFIVDSNGSAVSCSSDELFEKCLTFLNPAVEQHYNECLSLKLREKKNDSKLFYSFCLAFGRFVGPQFDLNRANEFVGMCVSYFHKNLDKNQFTYYPYDDFAPNRFGPNQTFHYSDDADKHYKRQMNQMTPAQKLEFAAHQNLLPSDLVAHNRLTESLVTNIRIKIERILQFILQSPATPDMLTIIHSNNAISTKEALRRMSSMSQKEEKKERIATAANKAKRVLAPLVPDIFSDEDDELDEEVSHTNTHFNDDEEEAALKLRRTALCANDDIPTHIQHALTFFESFFDSASGQCFVKARRIVSADAAFQLVGDSITALRPFHVELKFGVQVSPTVYIVPPLNSRQYAALSPNSGYLSMFANCRRVLDYNLANASVDTTGRLTLFRELNINEELVLHNPWVSAIATDAKRSQLALTLTRVVFVELLAELADGKTAKSDCIKACKAISDIINSNQWASLVQLCAYNLDRRPTDNQLALSDIVDTVNGNYQCSTDLQVGVKMRNYLRFPAWQRHLNFRSLRAAHNIHTWEDRRVWRHPVQYLQYHRSLKRQNIYCIGVTRNQHIIDFYSFDYEFLLLLPRGDVDPNNLHDHVSDLDSESGLNGWGNKRTRTEDGEESPTKRPDSRQEAPLNYEGFPGDKEEREHGEKKGDGDCEGDNDGYMVLDNNDGFMGLDFE